MKLYKFSYLSGVEGRSETKIKKIFSNSKYEAEKLFNGEFAGRIASTGIDKVTLLNTSEMDLPVLTDEQIKTAGTIFPNAKNPVEQYQMMLVKRN